MEELKQIIQRQQMVQRPSTLQLCSGTNITSQFLDGEISVYSGELNETVIVRELTRAKLAFPSLPVEYFGILSNRIEVNGFSDQRLIDAVDHVIDTCPYPTPSIAQFISFDRRFKVFTHEEMTKKVGEFGGEVWKSYKAMKFRNREKKVWVHVDDIKMYNLADEK